MILMSGRYVKASMTRSIGAHERRVAASTTSR
jgi:hypothetical protein